jgi:TonB family protein
MQFKTLNFIFIFLFIINTKSLKAFRTTLGDTSFIYTYVDENPSFKGGKVALETYLKDNVVTIKSEGIVNVNFVINTDGTIQDIEIIKSIGSVCDAEAKKIILNMPYWIPAKVNGKAVRFRHSLSISCGSSTDVIKEIPVSFVGPSYLGGDDLLFKFLGENVKYPNIARENMIQGDVIVEFLVNVDGSMSNIKVISDTHQEINNEAIRVVSLLKKWNPATQNGKPIKKTFKLPIRFRL